MVSLVFMLAGVCILGNWFFRYGGFDSLEKGPVRRNSMPIYMGFAAVILWLVLAMANVFILHLLPDDSDERIQELFGYILNGITQVCLIAAFLRLGKKYFARGLKGFGLDMRTIFGDMKMAVVNLAAVYPLVIGGLLIVVHLFNWPAEPHQSLDTIASDGPLPLKAIVIVTAMFLAPVFEEIMFRGIFQSSIISATGMRWVAIVMTSVLFTLQHPRQHYLAIFALSVGLGYAYERSGSLWRSIFMHMIFNSISVIATIFMS